MVTMYNFLKSVQHYFLIYKKRHTYYSRASCSFIQTSMSHSAKSMYKIDRYVLIKLLVKKIQSSAPQIYHYVVIIDSFCYI